MRVLALAFALGLALLVAAHAYTITGGESDTSSTLWWVIPAAGCVGTTPSSNWDMSGSDVPTVYCITGANTNKGVLGFLDAGKPSAQQTLLLPQAPTPATAAYVSAAPITVTILWYSGSTTGVVRWCASVVCRGDGEVDDGAAFGTEVCVDDATKTTTLQNNVVTITLPTASTTTCAPNELLHLKIARDAAHANDTTTGNGNMISATVAWQRFQ